MTPGVFQITPKVFLCCGDRFLVLRDRKARVGDLPGGRFGAGEIYQPWADSVAREINEELGPVIAAATDIAPEPLFYFPHFIQESGYEALGIAYRAQLRLAKLPASTLSEREILNASVQLSDEHDWFEWVDIRAYDPGALFVDHLQAAVRRFQSMSA